MYGNKRNEGGRLRVRRADDQADRAAASPAGANGPLKKRNRRCGIETEHNRRVACRMPRFSHETTAVFSSFSVLGETCEWSDPVKPGLLCCSCISPTSIARGEFVVCCLSDMVLVNWRCPWRKHPSFVVSCEFINSASNRPNIS